MKWFVAFVVFAGCVPKSTAPIPAAPIDTPEPVAVQVEPVVEKSVEEELNEAVNLLADGVDASAQRAIGILEALVRRQPDSAMVQFNYGVAQHRVGDVSGATRAYQATVGIDPSIGTAWLYLGRLQADEGRVDAAISNYRTGIRNAPEDIGLRVALADSLRQQGQLDAAIDEAKTALKVNANSVEVYNTMGLAYFDKGEFLLARFVFQKALDSISGADKNAYLLCNLGWTLYREGSVFAATHRLKEAVELDPDLVPANVYLARIYLDDHNYEDTVVLLERAAVASPDNHGVQMNLGIAYRGMGRFEDANRAYEQALVLDASNPDPYFNIGILRGDYLKDYAGAIDAFQAYVDRGGRDAESAQGFIKDVQKEQRRAKKRSAAEASRKKREAEAAERKRLLEQAEAEAAQPESAPPTPVDGTTPPTLGDGTTPPTPVDGATPPTSGEGSSRPTPLEDSPVPVVPDTGSSDEGASSARSSEKVEEPEPVDQGALGQDE